MPGILTDQEPVSDQPLLPEVPPVRERRSWPLPLLAPDVAAVAVLALTARHLDGSELVKAVLLAGAVLLVRRGAAGVWLGRDPASGGLAATRRQMRRGVLRWSVLLALGGAIIAMLWGHSAVVGPILAVAVLPASLVALEHQALRSCARRGQLLGSAVAGAAASVLVGAILLAAAPSVLTAVAALALGDLVALVVAWHRPHGGTCHAVGEPSSSTPLEAQRRPFSTAATASVLIGVMHLLPLGLVLRSGGDDTLHAALVVLGLLPLIAAGAVPVLVVPGLVAGRRTTVVPALLLGATLGSLATLLVMAAPGALLALPDHRLALHAAYFCVGTAMLGLGQVLLHYRVGTGNDRTGVILVVLAGGLELALMLVGTGPPAEVAVNAVLGGAGVLLVSLVVATAVAAPFPFVFPEEAGDGPRLVGPWLLGMVGLGLAVRLASFRPMWLDEAATARQAKGPFSGLLAGTSTADAHPPLQTALAWVARQVFGDGEIPLRLPSLMAGVLLVPLLYVVGKEIYGRMTGLVAATVGAVAPALVWFSSEARPPALAALLSVASLLMMVRALRWERGTDWVLFGLCGAALMWAHQLAFVHLAVLHVAVLVTLWRRRRDGRRTAPAFAGWAVAVVLVAAATVPLLIARSGLGPPRTLPPLEFATPAAPAGGVSVFAALGTAVSGVLGFHPEDVTSRLLALWPLGILAILLVLARARSPRGATLLAAAAAPFAAVLAAQLLGAPRSPPLALGWAATAVPIFCLLAGRAVSLLGGRWAKVRALGLAVGLMFLVAIADQVTRVKPVDRFDVKPVASAVGREAGDADLVLYEPRALRDLIAYEVEGTEARPVDSVSPVAGSEGRRVYIIGAFALGQGQESVDRAVAVVKELSATRPLLEERRFEDMTVWVFGP